MSKKAILGLSILFLFSFLTVAGAAEKTDLIITAAHVVTMDSAFHIYSPGALAIRGDTILAVGGESEILKRFQSARIVREGERWIMPGLVNTHSHIPMNPMRGVADDMELMAWLQQYIFPLEAKVVNGRYVYEASLVACAESIKRGVTTLVDMYYFEDEVARAVKEAGLRGFLGETILDFPAPDCKTPLESLAYTERCIQKWAADPLVRVVPAPHSLYTCSAEYLKQAKAMADRYDCLMLIHLSESNGEVETVRQKYNQTPVEAASTLGLLGSNVLAAHCVQLTTADMELLRTSNTAVAHNPDSNLKLASGLAPVTALLRQGVRVGLGTDGSASNNRQDMFHAMDLAAKIHKVRENDTTVMNARETVRMATLGGATALGQQKNFGSLEVGKKADLIVIDLSGPLYGPVYNIYSHLVYVAHGETVESAMVGGRWLMRHRRLLTLSEGRMDKLLAKLQGEIRSALPK